MTMRAAATLALVAVAPAQQGLPAEVSIARSLLALGRLDADAAQQAAAGLKGEAGERLRRAAGDLGAFAKAYLAAAATKKVRLFIPEEQRGKVRFIGWQVVGAATPHAVDLAKGKSRRTVPWCLVPPYFLAESAKKVGLLSEPVGRVLGLLVEVHALTLAAKARKRVEARVKRHGYTAAATDVSLVRRVAPHLMAAFDIEVARARLGTVQDPETVLTDLAGRLARHGTSAPQEIFLEHEIVPLLDDVFQKRGEVLPPLHGKVERLDHGRVRISYDWSRPDQLKDWSDLDGQQPILSLDNQRWLLRVESKAWLAHAVAFVGDVSVRASWGLTWRKRDGKDLFLFEGRPFVRICAQGKETGFSASPFEVDLFINGKSVDDKILSRKKIGAGRSIDDRVFLIERSKGRFRMSVGRTKLIDFPARTVAAQGSILIVRPDSPRVGEGEALLGGLIIEGTPDPATVDAARTAFRDGWRRRLIPGR
ncbi:MAG: hypothetical protein CMJ85_12105 [Planctomycetes bacterium]|nr:hypothetical protein [Planctomycetota bacterium]MDP6423295.1 hypothetical protein [Planctomycetota bacterium]